MDFPSSPSHNHAGQGRSQRSLSKFQLGSSPPHLSLKNLPLLLWHMRLVGESSCPLNGLKLSVIGSYVHHQKRWAAFPLMLHHSSWEWNERNRELCVRGLGIKLVEGCDEFSSKCWVVCEFYCGIGFVLVAKLERIGHAGGVGSSVVGCFELERFRWCSVAGRLGSIANVPVIKDSFSSKQARSFALVLLAWVWLLVFECGVLKVVGIVVVWCCLVLRWGRLCCCLGWTGSGKFA